MHCAVLWISLRNSKPVWIMLHECVSLHRFMTWCLKDTEHWRIVLYLASSVQLQWLYCFTRHFLLYAVLPNDFWATVCKMVRPMLPNRCLSVTLVYCGQTVGWIKMKLGVRPRPHCVRWGPSSPSPTIPAFTPQQQSITALWLVLISRPAEGRRLSWPEWLGEILRWFARQRWSPIPVLTRPKVE